MLFNDSSGLKIIYDISILGRAHLDARSRTGIFRVVESLFQELSRHDEAYILPTSLHEKSGFWDNYASQLYLKDVDPDLLESFVDFYSKKVPFYKIRTSIQTFLIKDAKKNRTLLSRSSRYAVASFCKAFDLLAGVNKISAGKHPVVGEGIDFTSVDIYHSPFLSFPSRDLLPTKTQRVITIYDLIPIKFPEFFTASQIDLINRAFSKIDADQDWVACISESTRNDFLDFFDGSFDDSRVIVTPLAASEKFYPVKNRELIHSVLRRHGIPPEVPYLLSLCTLEPRKNLKAVISSFAKVVLESRNPDLNLVLVGVKGWKNKDIFDEIAKNPDLESRIFLTGFVPDQDLSPIYSGAQCFVYPSFYEGFGLPPLEAMQCGVPVITSNTSSLPEVVGDAGIMVRPDDLDGLCQAIHSVLADNLIRADMASKSLQRAQQFSWSKCADETVKLYKQAVSSS